MALNEKAKVAATAIEVTAVINILCGGRKFVYIYQIYPPSTSIDTLVTTVSDMNW